MGNKVYLVSRNRRGEEPSLNAFEVVKETPKTYQVKWIRNLIGSIDCRGVLGKDDAVYDNFIDARNVFVDMLNDWSKRIDEEEIRLKQSNASLRELTEVYYKQKGV